MTILAIDPGTHSTAFVCLGEASAIGWRGFMDNGTFMAHLRGFDRDQPIHVAVEMVACYGMAVGKEVFETCLIVGRIQEICAAKGWNCQLVYRRDVKLHLCGSMRAKDGNVRQALIDKYGPQGNKKQPGPTYGISKHLWSALAIADYAASTQTK